MLWSDVILWLGALGFGAIAGSFLNALLFRFGTGKSVMSGRSRCMSCNRPLAATDLVPIFSFIFLRGKCRYCRAKISLQYPLVELAAALLSLLIFIQTTDMIYHISYQGMFLFAFWFLAWITLLFIIVYDLRHMVIPWSANIFLAALGLIYIWSLGLGVWSFAAGLILAAPLFLLSLASRGKWMGWADSLLELSLGWLLGLSLGATGLILAFWIGAVVGIVLSLASKRYTIKSEIPFAPFLALGAAISFFLHVDFFSNISALF